MRDQRPNPGPTKPQGGRDVIAVVEYLKRNARGTPLSTGQIASAIGMSAQFVRDEINAGELKAFRVGSRRRLEWRVSFAEAKRYLTRIGVIEVRS